MKDYKRLALRWIQLQVAINYSVFDYNHNYNASRAETNHSALKNYLYKGNGTTEATSILGFWFLSDSTMVFSGFARKAPKTTHHTVCWSLHGIFVVVTVQIFTILTHRLCWNQMGFSFVSKTVSVQQSQKVPNELQIYGPKFLKLSTPYMLDEYYSHFSLQEYVSSFLLFNLILLDALWNGDKISTEVFFLPTKAKPKMTRLLRAEMKKRTNKKKLDLLKRFLCKRRFFMIFVAHEVGHASLRRLLRFQNLHLLSGYLWTRDREKMVQRQLVNRRYTEKETHRDSFYRDKLRLENFRCHFHAAFQYNTLWVFFVCSSLLWYQSSAFLKQVRDSLTVWLHAVLWWWTVFVLKTDHWAC